MNKIFKKVWNRKRGCYVAVSEIMSSAAQAIGKACLVVFAGLLTFSLSTSAYCRGYLHGEVITSDSDLGHTDLDMNGDLTNNAYVWADTVNLSNHSNLTEHPDNFVNNGTLEVRYALNLGWTTDDSLSTAEYLTNNGTIKILEDAYLSSYGSAKNDVLQGDGIIIGGTIILRSLAQAHQNTIRDFKSLLIDNTDLSVSNLIGTGSVNLYHGASITAGLARLSNANFSGQSKFENLVVSGTVNNSGNSDISLLTLSGNYYNTGNAVVNKFEYNGGKFIQSSGTLLTDYNNVFDSVGKSFPISLSFIGLGQNLPQSLQTSVSSFFSSYLPGSVLQEFVNNSSLSGGKVIVRGVNLTTTQRDDLVKAFKAKFFLS